MNRRRFLHGAAALGAGAGLGLRPSVGLAADGLPTFLIVLGASGGASVLDGPMAIAAEESANSATLNCFPSDAVSSVGPFRAVQLERSSLGAIPYAFETSQGEFVRKHAEHMLVATLECTSVNHQVAQRRSVTGNEAWGGRTLQEIVALTHGEGLPIPNAHLATGTGFTEAGSDRSLPTWCFGEQVTDPRLFALALHGSRGVSGAPGPSVIERARAFRDDRLEPTSHFNRLFNAAPALARYRERRRAAVRLEEAGLIDALLLTEPSGEQGLTAAPELAQIAAAFPSYENNPLEAQAALAFLLLKNRVSASVTIAPSFNLKLDDGVTLAGGLTEGALHNPPIAFDYSHTGHRSAQAFMWAQIFSAADGLIDLLSGTELQDGVSFF
ncbi:MAG: twin-arginine translocation signal domain-containing protein, partial [Myxococcota bacterium]